MNQKKATPPAPTRRVFLIAMGTTALTVPAMLGARPLFAQETAVTEAFSFDLLTEAARSRAAEKVPEPEDLAPIFKDLTYDDYQMIQFRPSHAIWKAKDSTWNLLPFHLGWLFKEPVHLHEVADGMATELTFTTDDFEYRGHLKQDVPAGTALPGVAGFKLTHPLNRGDKMDEIISFVGASYFRALGLGNTYGLSARGLAIDSGLTKAEEFPRFSGFWLEKPAPGATAVTIYASLDSASVTGAYRFVVTPGVETMVEVTARLFFRTDVEQLGIAPLTSMFLFADVNRNFFDDYRPRVHDSNGLRIVRADGDVIWRALDNPRQLATSYFAETQPRRFGLHQRGRDFEDYQDAGARYDLRPSVDIEPIGDWGAGKVRLFELPTDVEVHDNIGTFWIPDQPVKAGDAREFAYKLHWGRLEPDYSDDRAIVWGTRGGVGGAAGLENPPDSHKFVVDFKGGLLGRLPDTDTEVAPVLTIAGGKADVVTLSKLPESDIWRMVADISADGVVVEMTAHIAGYGRKLSEIWSFQWSK
jgi:periplasmic glucans biosynthesis protein